MRLDQHVRRRLHWKQALGIMRALSVIVCALITIAGDAVAENWPTRPIKLVVPYSAGGSGDIVARELAQKLTTYLDRSFYVENRPGASGNLGTEYVAKSAPDGHTLLMASDIQFAISPNFTAGLPYEVKDFEPISLVASLDLVLAGHPSVGATNLRELAALARNRPGEINYGSTGAGSTHQLAMELLQQLGGFKLTEVPYRGSAQALPDLLSGQLHIMLMGIPQPVGSTPDELATRIAADSAKWTKVISGLRLNEAK